MNFKQYYEIRLREEEDHNDFDWSKVKTDKDTLQSLMDDEPTTSTVRKPKINRKSYMPPSKIPGYLDYLHKSKQTPPQKSYTDDDLADIDMDVLRKHFAPEKLLPKDNSFEDEPWARANVDQNTLQGLAKPWNITDFNPLEEPDRPGLTPPQPTGDKSLDLSNKERYIIQATRRGIPDDEILRNLGYKTVGPARKMLNQVRKRYEDN